MVRWGLESESEIESKGFTVGEVLGWRIEGVWMGIRRHVEMIVNEGSLVAWLC